MGEDMAIKYLRGGGKMTIEKAIERLNTFVERHPGYDYSDLIPAIKLGIEALKRPENTRRIYPNPTAGPLPSETKEIAKL